MAYATNSVKSGIIVTAKTNGGWYAELDWWQHPDYSENRSLIKWRAYIKNDNSNIDSTSYITTYGVKFYVGGAQGLEQEFWPEPASLGYQVHYGKSSATKQDWGSFVINHDKGTGKAKIILTLAAWLFGSTDNYKYSSGPKDIELSPIILYTPCEAPSNLNFIGSSSSSIIAPKNSITYEFSAGTSGTSNPIDGYRIYWSVGNKNFAMENSFWTTSIKGTISIGASILDSYRGQTLYFGVQTIGKVSGYDSSIANASQTIKVNNLPSEPTGSNKTIPSSQSKGHLDISPGRDNDGQTYTVYYKKQKDDSLPFQLYTSDTELDPGLYSFATYDGLEYSSIAIGRQLFQNTAPTITLAWSGTPSIGESNHSGYTRTDVSYLKSGTISYTLNKAGSLNIDIFRTDYNNTEGATPTYSSASSQTYTYSSTATTAQTRSLDFANILNANCFYKIRATFNDGIETTTKELTKYNDKWLSLAPAPELKASYNQHNNGNVANALDTHFWNKIRLVYSYDSGYTYSATASGIAITTKISDGEILDAKVKYIDITTGDSLTPGASYTFTGKATSPSGSFSTASKTYQQAYVPNISSMSFGQQSYPVYTVADTEKLNIYPTKFWRDNGLDQYDMQSWDWLKQNLKLSLLLNGVEYNISNIILPESELAADSFAIEAAPADVFDALQRVGDKNRQYSTNAVLRLTNLFGREFVFTSSNTFIISFLASPTIVFSKAKIDIVPKNTIIEGSEITFAPAIKGYNGEQILCTIQIKRGESNWVDYRRAAYKRPSDGSPQRGIPITYELSGGESFTSTVGEIDSNDSCRFRAVIDDGYNSVVYSEEVGGYARARHIPAKVVLTNAVYDDSKTLTLTYRVDDLGIDTNRLTFSNSFVSRDSESGETAIPTNSTEGVWQNFENGTLSIAFTNIDLSGSDSGSICLFVQTTSSISDGSSVPDDEKRTITVTKTATSSTINFFANKPTIALRKNSLGINTSIVPEDAVLLMRAPNSGKNTVRLRSSTGTFEIIFNLESGTVDGLVYDGGTW